MPKNQDEKGTLLRMTRSALTARGTLKDPRDLALLERLKMNQMTTDQLEALEYLSELIWVTGRRAGKAEL